MRCKLLWWSCALVVLSACEDRDRLLAESEAQLRRAVQHCFAPGDSVRTFDACLREQLPALVGTMSSNWEYAHCLPQSRAEIACATLSVRVQWPEGRAGNVVSYWDARVLDYRVRSLRWDQPRPRGM